LFGTIFSEPFAYVSHDWPANLGHKSFNEGQTMTCIKKALAKRLGLNTYCNRISDRKYTS